MQFGIFYEHQLPRPWGPDSERRLIQDALDQVELADRLGIEYLWEVEHHFLEEYSHSSAPEIFLAACSQRTKQIRLGHGVVLMPPPINHPARIAERIATLDLVSNGRVEFGTGESSSDMELLGFNVERSLKRVMWEETVHAVAHMLAEEPFTGIDGRFCQMPARNIVPKPVQRPHPPLWVACSRRDTIHMAAQRGIGALSFSFINPEEAHHWVTDYYTTLEQECDPIGLAINPNLAIVTTFMCDQDESRAIEKGLKGTQFFGYSLSHYYIFGEHIPGWTNVWEAFEKDPKMFNLGHEAEANRAKLQAQAGGVLGSDLLLPGGLNALRGCVGTPEQIRGFLRQYEEAGVDQVIFVSQAGNNKHEDICESLELFAREVLPEFKERDAVRQKKKQERLAPTIERIMAGKKSDLHPEVDLVVKANPMI